MSALTDTQNSVDTRNIKINRVGIKNFKSPIKLMVNNSMQTALANIDLYTSLDATHRGTHMSRFIALLTKNEKVINPATIKDLLNTLSQELDAKNAEIILSTVLFLDKAAPVTKIKGIVDYEIQYKTLYQNDSFQQYLTVIVPATSLCPCSKEISEYGAHNQRSLITITILYDEPIPPEELINIAEKNASCGIYSLLKRPDEKYVTEWAYNHPKFVEDIVRDIYSELSVDKRILEFTINSENFESIHNHSAFAEITSTSRE